MKKFFSVLFLCFIVFIAAQVRLGVKTGINISTLYGDMSSTDAKAGLYLGVYTRIPITDRFSIQPEVMFSMQGAETNDDYWNGYWFYRRTYKEKYELNYFQIPIMFQYEMTRGLRAEIGPQFGFAVFKKHKYRDYTSNTYSRTEDEDMKTFDVGLSAGINYEVDSGLNFSFRYTIGFINVNDSNNEFYYDYDIRNMVFALGVGYTF